MADLCCFHFQTCSHFGEIHGNHETYIFPLRLAQPAMKAGSAISLPLLSLSSPDAPSLSSAFSLPLCTPALEWRRRRQPGGDPDYQLALGTRMAQSCLQRPTTDFSLSPAQLVRHCVFRIRAGMFGLRPL